MTICKFVNCKTQAYYGQFGTENAEYCVSHKISGYVYIAYNKCLYIGCNILPTFGEKGTHKPLYCYTHKPHDYVDVANFMCTFKNCNKHATFGLIGTKIALFRYDHSPDNYVDVLNPKCTYENCTTRPSFGQIGSHRAEYCVMHKPPDYINVVGEKCKFMGCTTKPTFNEPGLSKPIWCKQHKSVNMIDVTHKKCTFEECITRPNFGIIGTKEAISCAKHKLSNYVNVLSKLCQHEDCTKQPIFGDPKIRQKTFCSTHKIEGYVDVVNKMCEAKDCQTRASYGPLFSTHKHCATHRNNNEYLKNKPKCPENNCKEMPCYTDKKDNYPIRCEIHKITGDINVVERKCNSCKLMFYIREGNNCNDCSLFFNRKINKVKENNIKLLLENNDIKFVNDKIPESGCNRYRPDFVIDFGLNIVIVECDEDQHKSYACTCEQARMINLFQDFGGCHITFIRYNPDSYKDNNGNRRSGSSTMNHKRLISAIKSLELHPPDKPLTVIYLCYDGDDGSNQLLTIDYENLMINKMPFEQITLNMEDNDLLKNSESKQSIDKTLQIKPKLALKSTTKKIQLKAKKIQLKPPIKLQLKHTITT